MSLSHETEALIRMGLTKNQAKIYISLVQSGPATVKQISKNAKVPRENVYRTIPSLFKMGLIQKDVTTPIKLEAFPIKTACSLLIDCKTKELQDLQNEIGEMIYNLQMKTPKMKMQEEVEILLVPKGKRLITVALSELENAGKSACIIILYKRFVQFLHHYPGAIKKALERNIDYRIMTNITEYKKELPESIQVLEKMPSFKMRNITPFNIVDFGIYDNKKVLIGCSTSTDLAKGPGLLSNNPCIVRLAQNYFDILWSNLSDVNSKNQ